MGNEISSVILGFLMPLIVDACNATFGIENKKWKFAIAFGSSILGGLLISLISNNLQDKTEILANIGVIFAMSQTVYKEYWEDSLLRKEIKVLSN